MFKYLASVIYFHNQFHALIRFLESGMKVACHNPSHNWISHYITQFVIRSRLSGHHQNREECLHTLDDIFKLFN